MRNSPAWWLLIVVMILLDLYFFQALKVVTHSGSPRIRTIIYVTYWVLSVSVIVFLLLLPYLHYERVGRVTRTTLFAIIAGLFFAKLFASLFFMIDDLRRFVQWIAGKISPPKATAGEAPGEGITRSVFLSWMGIIAGS